MNARIVVGGILLLLLYNTGARSAVTLVVGLAVVAILLYNYPVIRGEFSRIASGS